jgi:hypothetical protein
MWIFLSRSWLSIVQHLDDPDMLLVRSRVEGDIQRAFPNAEVEEQDDLQYRYRAVVPRAQVAGMMKSAVDNLSATSYKASLDTNRRRRAASRVWSAISDVFAENPHEIEGIPTDIDI